MKKILIIFLLIGLIGAISGFFVAFGPPKLMAKTSAPEYCATCHVMKSQYEDWFHSGAHKRAKCVDCHLPNHNKTAHYFWKSIDGLKDVLVFYSGNTPENIKLTHRAKNVLQANCIKCHNTTVEHIDQQRNCWDCHRRVQHKQTGIREKI